MSFVLRVPDATVLEQVLTAEQQIVTDGGAVNIVGWQGNGLPFFAWRDDRFEDPFAAAVMQCPDGTPNNGHVSELVYPVLIPHLDSGTEPVMVKGTKP